jgi:hypothetical protein
MGQTEAFVRASDNTDCSMRWIGLGLMGHLCHYWIAHYRVL